MASRLFTTALDLDGRLVSYVSLTHDEDEGGRLFPSVEPRRGLEQPKRSGTHLAPSARLTGKSALLGSFSRRHDLSKMIASGGSNAN